MRFIQCKDLSPNFINLPIYDARKLTMGQIKEKISEKVGVNSKLLKIFKTNSGFTMDAKVEPKYESKIAFKKENRNEKFVF